jgi:pyrrolidone-carboxylate peptidase
MAEANEVPEELGEWAATLAYEFGLEPEQVPVGAILALAADAAHGVTRPAAPVTAFVAGLVAGQRGATPEEIAEAIAAARSLIADRDDAEPTD